MLTETEKVGARNRLRSNGRQAAGAVLDRSSIPFGLARTAARGLVSVTRLTILDAPLALCPGVTRFIGLPNSKIDFVDLDEGAGGCAAGIHVR